VSEANNSCSVASLHKGLPLGYSKANTSYALFIHEKPDRLILPANVKVTGANQVLQVLRQDNA
jgi:hypothetical protein